MLQRLLEWSLMVPARPPTPCKSTKSRLPDAEITKGHRSLHFFLCLEGSSFQGSLFNPTLFWILTVTQLMTQQEKKVDAVRDSFFSFLPESASSLEMMLGFIVQARPSLKFKTKNSTLKSSVPNIL